MNRRAFLSFLALAPALPWSEEKRLNPKYVRLTVFKFPNQSRVVAVASYRPPGAKRKAYASKSYEESKYRGISESDYNQMLAKLEYYWREFCA